MISFKCFIKIASCLGLLYLVLTSTSCSQNDDGFEPEYLPGSNAHINQWIYKQMQRYYLWNSALPVQSQTNLSLSPQDYFKSITSATDRYSYTYHPALKETFSQNLRKSFGFDMDLVRVQGKSFATVLYSLPDSPAMKVGLTRGILISAIDDQNITETNFENLYDKLIEEEQVNLSITSYSKESGFIPLKQIQLSQRFTLNPPIKGKVISRHGKKIGYINLPYFEVGMAGGFANVFQEFKSQGVSEVVLDLRYNGGGDVSSAAALSIILAPSIKGNDRFITFKGNKNGGIVNQSFREALEVNETNVSFEALRTVHPSIYKVYVLCGKRTASASEIIINNLSPYMKVVTIGETTYGKNYAGFTIQDNRDSKSPGWVLFPVIYKLYNADGIGDYREGLSPRYKLNELKTSGLSPLGDPQEILFEKALELIAS